MRRRLRSSLVLWLTLVGTGACRTTPSGPTPSTPDRLDIDAPRTTLAVGESVEMWASETRRDGSVVAAPSYPGTLWQCVPADACDVTHSGLVTGLAAGTVTLTATAGSLSATRTLTIVARASPLPVRLRLLDHATGDGLAGVPVQINAADGAAVTTTAPSDAAGVVAASLPGAGPVDVFVRGLYAGSLVVPWSGDVGDLILGAGRCIGRYGTVLDGRNLRPVSGATVSLAGGTAASAANGWYRVDLGCPDPTMAGFGTTFINVSHPDYLDRQMVVGRGVPGMTRLDLALTRR